MRIIMILCVLFSAIVIGQPSNSLLESLSPWEPLSITVKNGKLIIVTNEPKVTNTIFTAIIKNGICMPIWLGDPEALDDISEVIVLNKFEQQGYVFEGGKSSCDEMGKLNSEKSEIYLLGHSRIYTTE